MSTAGKYRPLFTVEQYLALERAAEDRHEYIDGEIFAMAGESLEHGSISTNLSGILYNQLRGSPCRVLSKDTKIRSGPNPGKGQGSKGLFSYPDVLVLCGEPEYHDDRRDVILNPKVIVEILSEGTESFDRGEKCFRYQTWNPTLSDYLLVSQKEPLIEHFNRQANGTWTFQRYFGLDATINLASISCTLILADVYERVVFRAPE